MAAFLVAPLIGLLATFAGISLATALMMRRIWHFLTDTGHLTIATLIAMVLVFYLGATALELALAWALAASAVTLLVVALVWGWRRWRARCQSEHLAAAIGAPAATSAA